MSQRPSVVGDVIAERYRVVREIGAGGSATVYEAETLADGQAVALKLLRTAPEAERSLERFRREATLVKKLSHPHVVRVLDFGQTALGQTFIALELLRGQSLAREIERSSPASSSFTASLAAQVLAALAQAHGAGIVHRDLKPANIFLCSDEGTEPFVKVLDFGIAGVTGTGEDAYTRLTRTGQLLGTPNYMAPEQVMGEPVGPPTDIYALGLVLAETICGSPIVGGKNDIEILLTQAKPEPLSLPPAVAEAPLGPVIERALQKRPEARYASAAAMGADLRAHLPASAVSETNIETKPLPNLVFTQASADAGAAEAESLAGEPGQSGELVRPKRAAMTAYQLPAKPPDSPTARVHPSPVQATAASPVQATAASPVQATAASPVQATAASPVQATAASPVQTTFQSPPQGPTPAAGFTELAAPTAQGLGFAPAAGGVGMVAAAPQPQAAVESRHSSETQRTIWILLGVGVAVLAVLLIGALLGAIVWSVSDRAVAPHPNSPAPAPLPGPVGNRPHRPAGPLDRLTPERLLAKLKANGWRLHSADAHRISRQSSLTYSYQLMVKGQDLCNIQLYKYPSEQTAKIASDSMTERPSAMVHTREGATLLLVACPKGDTQVVHDRLLRLIR